RAADLDVPPAPAEAVVSGQIRCRESAVYVLQFHTVGQPARVATGARVLDRDSDVRITVHVGFPKHLGISEEQHPVRTPIIEDVGKHIDIHELAVGDASADLPILPPCMPQAYRRLSCESPDAEHIEFEDPLDRPVIGRELSPRAETALPRAEIEVAVPAELVMKAGE